MTSNAIGLCDVVGRKVGTASLVSAVRCENTHCGRDHPATSLIFAAGGRSVADADPIVGRIHHAFGRRRREGGDLRHDGRTGPAPPVTRIPPSAYATNGVSGQAKVRFLFSLPSQSSLSLVFVPGQEHMEAMAKPRVTPKNATKRSYKAVGKLSDGVIILAPKTKPTHFTSKQIRSTIQEVLKKVGKDDVGEADPKRG